MKPVPSALQSALDAASVHTLALRPMPDKGLAHEHVWLERADGKDWVARLPKQSQMSLSPDANLKYQACCFERASAGGHTPALHGILPANEALPRGGLLVSGVRGREARLPDDLDSIADALASLHRLPLPEADSRPPLLDAVSPWQAMCTEIRQQAEYLDQAQLDTQSVALIQQERRALENWLAGGVPVIKTLISFDAHPGNFLIRLNGRAVLVDLEKCRYALPGFDLAHATLYTSTTWDIDTHAVLTVKDVQAFYRRWANAMADCPQHLDALSILQCRRAMWLWSITWCAKWRVERLRSRDASVNGQDWSTDLSDDRLVEHVADRVDHYLTLPIIAKVCDEWQALQNSKLFEQ